MNMKDNKNGHTKSFTPAVASRLVRPGLEPGSSVYMTDALPTELLTTPAEMSEITLTDGS